MKLFKRALVFFILCAAVFVAILTYQGYILYSNAIEAEPLSNRVERVREQERYVKIENLPDTYLKAVVAVEDRRFYSHNGIDITSTVRAIINDIKARAFVEGGSTITQQLAKNLYFSQEKVLSRKVAELFLAFDIEAAYSKEDILELYVNSIYFGSGYYCVYDAAMGYFMREPRFMSDNQSTLLAGIPNAPSVYSLDSSPELAFERQQYVLSCMAECGYISAQRAEEILNEAG